MYIPPVELMLLFFNEVMVEGRRVTVCVSESVYCIVWY